LHLKQPGSELKKRDRQQMKLTEKEWEEKMRSKGLDPVKERLNSTTAEIAQKEYKQKSKKKEELGWSPHNMDVAFAAYKKKVKRTVRHSQEEYNQRKEEATEEEFFPDLTAMPSSQAVAPDALDRVANELTESQRRQKDFSRHRTYVEEKDVSYINKRNRVFNEKLSRAYDEYTVEIRQNLERGTAI